jgi:hypothetical protein
MGPADPPPGRVTAGVDTGTDTDRETTEAPGIEIEVVLARG